MAQRLIFGGIFIRVPGHYGPFCVQCNAPIMFDRLRKRNSKCDKCNGFTIHSCKEAESVMFDPNKENSIHHELWRDGDRWYGELDWNPTMEYSPPYHFRVLNCPFCGILLKKD